MNHDTSSLPPTLKSADSRATVARIRVTRHDDMGRRGGLSEFEISVKEDYDKLSDTIQRVKRALESEGIHTVIDWWGELPW